MREKRWYQRLWWRAMVPALVPFIDPSEDPHDGVDDSQHAGWMLTKLIDGHRLHCNPPLVSTNLRSHDQAQYWHVRFEPKLLGYSTGENHHR